MNYCDKIHYNLYQTEAESFEDKVVDLLSQLPESEQAFRLVFFGAPADNEQYVSRYLILRNLIRRYYGDREPVLSYVSQPALSGGIVLESHTYQAGDEDTIRYAHYEGLPYVVLENPDGRFLYAGGFHGDVLNFGIKEQSEVAFRQLEAIMRSEGFPINSIIRQWNYIERITAMQGADQHYQMFNNARSEFYSRTEWKNGYPAATGIGANLGGVLIDVDAAVFSRPECFATPIDNKLQVAAHAYSTDVLVAAQQTKTTPKFERAKSMTFDDRILVYISGTAAIRGEESLFGVGLEKQLRITMENIDQLIGNAELKMLRVYLKEKSFYEEAVQLMESYQLNIPISYMWTDVCRDELLIEIEGIAIQ